MRIIREQPYTEVRSPMLREPESMLAAAGRNSIRVVQAAISILLAISKMTSPFDWRSLPPELRKALVLSAALLFVCGGLVHLTLLRAYMHWYSGAPRDPRAGDHPATVAAIVLFGGGAVTWFLLGLFRRMLEEDEPRLLPFLLKGKKSRRSEEHTSELQSRPHLVCRLLLEKKKKKMMQEVLCF